MGHSTGKPFEMGKLMQNVSCSFFFYSFSSFASQITILYYLNFIWLKYFTFISAELFCMTIRQAQFHGQRGNSRSRRGCNPQHMMGEQHPSPKSFPPCIKGWSLTRNESSENQNQLLREENSPQLWPVLTNLSTAAFRSSQIAESHLPCGAVPDTALQGAQALPAQLEYMTHCLSVFNV